MAQMILQSWSMMNQTKNKKRQSVLCPDKSIHANVLMKILLEEDKITLFRQFMILHKNNV
jgi:hypothetical protein